MDYQYLTQEQLNGFENYKYSSVDTNPLSVYVMHPFWNKIVLIFPKWIAPNLLTFVGFLFTAAACLMLSIYDYKFYAGSDDCSGHDPIPRWVFALVSSFIFIAYTLDGIDGKQARRTGTSGPLGELFDHGLDSWTAVLIPTCLYSVFGRTDHSVPPMRFYFVCWNVFITFYLSHWEKYNTGILFLPWGYDLSMIATTGVFAVSAYTGHAGWKFKLTENISTGHVLETVFYLSSVCTSLPVTLWNIYRSYRDRTGKMRNAWEANRPLVPVAVFLAVTVTWSYYSPSNIIERDPRAFYLLTGTIFSNICCRLIVSQMSNTRCSLWNVLLFPTMLVTALSLLIKSPTLEFTLLHLLWLMSTLVHIHYGTCVVRQMCRHFGIRCFHIKESCD